MRRRPTIARFARRSEQGGERVEHLDPGRLAMLGLEVDEKAREWAERSGRGEAEKKADKGRAEKANARRGPGGLTSRAPAGTPQAPRAPPRKTAAEIAGRLGLGARSVEYAAELKRKAPRRNPRLAVAGAAREE